MKKFTKILLIGCLLVMVSCNNWLDVDPKSQVKDKDLFASESQFFPIQPLFCHQRIDP